MTPAPARRRRAGQGAASAAGAWLVLASVACSGTLPAPYPRVVSASPAGAVPPDEVAVEIVFSAPVEPAGLVDGRLLALCRREDLRAVVEAAESSGGLRSGAPLVAARVEVAPDGTRAVLRPEAPLEPGRLWAAVLSQRLRAADGRAVLDPEGRARTFAVLFETGPAVDRAGPRPRWIHPPHGPVPPNLRRVLIGFDEAVSGSPTVDGSSIASVPLPPGPGVLGLELTGPLPPGALNLDLRAVRDAAGNPAAPLEPLAVSACPAAAPPPVGDARLTSGDLSVAIEAALGGMGALAAEVSTRPGEPACGAAPAYPATATVTGAVPPCPGWDPCAPSATACHAEVRVTGLCPGQPVRLRLVTEDLAGHRGAEAGWREVSALPPRPVPAVTEVLADADSPEQAGEYVEVANLGTGDLVLTGLALAKHGPSGRVVRCTIAAAPGGVVPPGGHALVVGGAYDGRYATTRVPVYACGAAALLGGLPNDRPVQLALEGPAGEVLSTAGLAEAAPRCAAGALERIHPGGPDAASNWACPGGRTPGACNQDTPPAECPVRGW